MLERLNEAEKRFEKIEEERKKYFPKETVVGWCLIFEGHPLGMIRETSRIHEKYFKKDHSVFIWKDILNEEEASKNLLQFSSKDKITIIPFNHQILGEYTTEDGRNTKDLINKITSTSVSGGTDIYLPAMKGLEILSQEDLETYNVSIVLMTDGASNYNRLDELTRLYKQTGKDIPIFSIMFGEAEEEQLQDIADLTNAKIFDGKTNLLEAFKQVRGYN